MNGAAAGAEVVVVDVLVAAAVVDAVAAVHDVGVVVGVVVAEVLEWSWWSQRP